MNSWRRKAPLVVAILLLSLPAALGIIQYLEPTRGKVGSRSAAIGFEMLYLSIGVLILSKDLRKYARSVAICAVITSVTFNTLADYVKRVPEGLKNTPTFLQTFDSLSAILSFIESLPLAGLAYAATILIHRLQEDFEAEPSKDKVSWWSRIRERFQKSLPVLDFTAVLRDAFVLRQRNPTAALSALMTRQAYDMLRTELTRRRDSGESKTATIGSLWNVSGGTQYIIASRIYDELTT